MGKLLTVWLFVFCAFAPGSVLARAQRVDAVEVELIADRTAVVPGQPLTLGLRIRHDPHWHTYWRNPGDSGLPTQLELRLPAGFRAGPMRWPAPQRLPVGPLMNFGYDGEIVLPVPVTAPARVEGSQVQFSGQAQWLVCKDVCIPGEAQVELSLPVAAQASPASRATLFDSMAARIPSRSLAARAAVDGRTLSLAINDARAQAAEFFPYADGVIDNAAAQELHRLSEDPPGSRLALRLAAKVDEASLRQSGFFESPAGVAIVDGVPFEVVARAVPRLAGGEFVSRVAAAGQSAAPASAPVWPGLGGTRSGEGAAAFPAPGTAADAAAGPTDTFDGGAGKASSLGVALLLALLGGLVLNLMPCVFPVIGLKVLAFAQRGPDGGHSGRVCAGAFAVGVLASFWVLAGMLVLLQRAGESVGWGFQLQSPVFVTALALLFVAIGLNLAGLFEVGLAATRLGPQAGATPQRPLGAFGSGVLAVLVATPCTAPFMGSALGFTIGRPAAEAFAVFTALGVGMALPYLLLGWFPAALGWLPRPGRWMQTLRQALAFPMFATAAWLAWVLALQAGPDAVFGLTIAAVLLAFAAWSYGRFVQPSRSPVGILVAVLALAAAGWSLWPVVIGAVSPADARQSGDPSAGWQPWSDGAVARGRADGRPVFVDFTAAWCVSCQANKKLVLERAAVVGAMDERRVLRLRADWTRRDPDIGRALARFGRNGVPLYLVYLPGREAPILLPELLTSSIVLRAISAEPASASAGGAAVAQSESAIVK